MIRLAPLVVLLVGCATRDHSANEPAFTGDSCAAYTSATACQSDSDCTWFGTGCACPPNDPTCVCSPGDCAATNAGSSSGSGSAETGAACSCPDGQVCFEQIGGPSEPAGGPPIECVLPSPGDGDACARIQGQGSCDDSTTVSGLCLCDDGNR